MAASNPQPISIVIPVALADAWPRQLITELAGTNDEIIMVCPDPAPADLPRQVSWHRAPRSRGGQIALGIARSQHAIIWVLHGDCRNLGAAHTYLRTLPQTPYLWGRFNVDIPGVPLVPGLMNMRSRISKICTGDQGMFFSRRALELAGGYAAQPLMEDIETSRRLRRVLARYFKPAAVTIEANGERWRKAGWWATVIAMWGYRLRYFFGTSAERLYGEYYPSASRPGQFLERAAEPAVKARDKARISQGVLAVFTKVPVLGEVKTRLAADIGAQAALQAHCTLVSTALKRFNTVAALERYLWLSGPHEVSDTWAAVLDGEVRLQSGADLGARMANTVTEHFCQGADCVVLVGCDCPGIDADYIAAAMDALTKVDVVFGPAEDGGYGLIGLHRQAQPILPLLFEKMPWGTARVIAASRARLQAQQHVWHELDVIWDVDELKDWQRYLAASGAA